MVLSLPKSRTHLSSPSHALRAPHLILLDLITWIIFGKECKLLSSSLCSFFHFPVTSYFSAPNILLSTLFSSYPQPNFLPQCERPFFTPIQNDGQIYLKIYIFGYQTGRQKILHWMISSIPDFNLPLIFFLNKILIPYGCSQKSYILRKFGWRVPKEKSSRNIPERSPPLIFCY